VIKQLLSAFLRVPLEQLVRRVEAERRSREPQAQPQLHEAVGGGGSEEGGRREEAGRQEFHHEARWPRPPWPTAGQHLPDTIEHLISCWDEHEDCSDQEQAIGIEAQNVTRRRREAPGAANNPAYHTQDFAPLVARSLHRERIGARDHLLQGAMRKTYAANNPEAVAEPEAPLEVQLEGKACRTE